MIEMPDKAIELIKSTWPHFACIFAAISFLAFTKQKQYRNRE